MGSWSAQTDGNSSSQSLENMNTSVEQCLEGQLCVLSTLDDKDDVAIDNETHLWIKQTVWVGGIFIAAVLGIPGNVLSAVVFYRQGLRERINLCLFAHAVTDLSVDIVYLMRLSDRMNNLLNGGPAVVDTYMHSLAGFVWASQFLSAVIASERCFCVVSPFHAKRLLKTSTMAAIIVVCCVVLIVGMAVTVGLKYTLGTWTDPMTNLTHRVLYFTSYYLDNKVLVDVVDIAVYSIVISGCFLIVVIVATSITIAKLRAALAWRRRVTAGPETAAEVRRAGEDVQAVGRSQGSQKELSVTFMQIVTSILFVVHVMPNLGVQMAVCTVPGWNTDAKYRAVSNITWQIVEILWTVNSSLNFIVYVKTGSKFRESLKGLITGRICNQ